MHKHISFEFGQRGNRDKILLIFDLTLNNTYLLFFAEMISKIFLREYIFRQI